jgi:hypothetical protein
MLQNIMPYHEDESDGELQRIVGFGQGHRPHLAIDMNATLHDTYRFEHVAEFGILGDAFDSGVHAVKRDLRFPAPKIHRHEQHVQQEDTLVMCSMHDPCELWVHVDGVHAVIRIYGIFRLHIKQEIPMLCCTIASLL